MHYSLIHMTNWIINGLPERFPKLKVLWIESGLAWIPFLMQRLDHEYQMRTCEAPMLKRLPSEYMRDMFYTSQPMEKTNLKLLQATMEAFNAETQLLYASDWPHWDFDAPSSITTLPFLERAGQAQHPRAQRRAHLQSRGQAQAAEGRRTCWRRGRACPDDGGAGAAETAAVLGDDFVAAAERALSSGQPGQVSDAELERVMTAAVRLYAAKAETDQPPAQPITPSSVTPTEIVVTVSDMIRAAGLNLWDVSMWFNRMQKQVEGWGKCTMREVKSVRRRSSPIPAARSSASTISRSRVFKLGGEFYAYLNHCPHMGGPACQGKMIAKVEEDIAARPHQQGHDLLQDARCTSCARGTASSSTSAPASIPAIRRRGCARSRSRSPTAT